MRLILLTLVLGWWLFGQGLEQVWNVEALSNRFADAKSWAWLAGIGLLVADLLLPIPGTIVMSALGVVYGFWIGGVIAAVGSMLAGILGYGVGQFFNEDLAKRWLGERDFERGRALFGRGGAWVVAMRALLCTATSASAAALLALALAARMASGSPRVWARLRAPLASTRACCLAAT